MIPKFDLSKIKFSTDEVTFQKAVALYEQGKIQKFKKDFRGCSATVLGGSQYNVYVSLKNLHTSDCDCYMGQNNYLCKHIVAVSIYAVLDGEAMKTEEKEINNEPACSNRLGRLNEFELSEVKKAITDSLRYIKGYVGPSKKWFAYQDSLQEGCNRLAFVVSKLPISSQTSDLIVSLLLRMDKKLSEGGVDDSDGTVGNCIYGLVAVLEQYVKFDKNCLKSFKALCNQSTCFDWEESLVRILDESEN